MVQGSRLPEEVMTKKNDPDFLGKTVELHKINKAELNDLVHDLNLPKMQTELLFSRLKS